MQGFQENSTHENSTHENSTHENSTQRKFHPRKIPPNNRLKGGVYLTQPNLIFAGWNFRWVEFS